MFDTTNEKLKIAFPIIGQIRKGAPKTVGANGKTNVGKDLNENFRMVFSKGAEQYQVLFNDAYKTLQPSRIQAMLPFRNVAQSYECFNEVHQSGRMVARATDDHYITMRNPANGEYIIRDGVNLETGEVRPFIPGETIVYERNGRRFELKPKKHGRLKLWLPVFDDLVMVELKTTSYYDDLNITSQLGAIQAMAETLNSGNAAGIPLWIYRQETEVCWNKPDGTAARVKKWLINIKADMDWTKAAMARLRKFALGEAMPSYLLPAETKENAEPPVINVDGPEWFEDEEGDEENQVTESSIPEAGAENVTDGSFTEIPTSEPVTASVDAPIHDTGRDPNARPYPPASVRAKLQERRADFTKEANQAQRGLLRGMLDTCLAGAGLDDAAIKERREQVCLYLFDQADSFKVADDLVQVALKLWLKPVKDSGGAYKPCKEAAEEAGEIYRQAVIEAGQIELPF